MISMLKVVAGIAATVFAILLVSSLIATGTGSNQVWVVPVLVLC